MRSRLTLATCLASLTCCHLSSQSDLSWILELKKGSARSGGTAVLELHSGSEIDAEELSGLPRSPAAELWSEGERLDLRTQVDRMGESLAVLWVHPAVTAGDSPQYELRIVAGEAAAREVAEARNEAALGGLDLRVGERPLLRYMYGFDPQRREETYKVFHHVYDFAGEGFLTKGAGGRFSHHRGLFLGFNQMEVGARKMDFWHCHEGLRIVHQDFLESRPGVISSSAGYLIHWVDGEGAAIVEEERRLRAWSASKTRHILDFDIRLRSLAGRIRLAGDAQHAGFQFRTREAAAGAPELKLNYLRQENAVAKGNDVWVDCSWVAGLFEQDGRKYAVVHMDSESNPRPNRYSTRDYGRFGSTFDVTLTDESLRLQYRILIIDVDAEGLPEVASLEADYRSFVEPLEFRVLPR
ncbi:MAG: DUF6807 family protein [Planctomycetota bacterium]